MAGFLYFAAGNTRPVTAELLAQLDLAYAFEATPMNGPLDHRTPSGDGGYLFTNESRQQDHAFAYRPDEQVWKKRPGDDGIYIGWWKDSPPTAADLVRSKLFEGEMIELAQGGQWMIPRLRTWAGDSGFRVSLPARAGIDENGNWIVAGIETRFKELDTLADRLYAGMVLALLGQAESLTTLEALDAVTQLLAVNYCVSKFELGFMEALPTDSRLSDACRAAIDYDAAEEWTQKKT